MHWTERRLRKKDYGWLLIKAGARDVQPAEAYEKRAVDIHSYREKLLDPDNLYGSVKLLLDSMEDLGLIWDDGPEYLSLSVSQKIDRKNLRTEIIIKGETNGKKKKEDR